MKITITLPDVKDCEILVTGTDTEGYAVEWHVHPDDLDVIGNDPLESQEPLEEYVRELRGIEDDEDNVVPCYGPPFRQGEQYYGLVGWLNGLTRAEAIRVACHAIHALADWMKNERFGCGCHCHESPTVGTTEPLCKADGCDGRGLNFGSSDYCDRHACDTCGDAGSCEVCMYVGEGAVGH